MYIYIIYVYIYFVYIYKQHWEEKKKPAKICTWQILSVRRGKESQSTTMFSLRCWREQDKNTRAAPTLT